MRVLPVFRPFLSIAILAGAAMFAACRFVTVTKAPDQGRLNGMPMVFREDFEKGADRWIPNDPAAWKLAEEGGNHYFSQFQQSKYEPPFRSPFNFARIKDLKVGTCIVDARVQQMGAVAGESHRDMVIVFGWQDPAHFYYAHIGKEGDDYSHQIHIVNGAPRASILKSRTKGVDWGTGWHNLRLARNVESGAIDVYLDDFEHPVLSASDTTFGAGGIGLGTFDDIGNIDDIRIYAAGN